MTQLNLLTQARVELPEAAELQRRFARFNLELFNSKLPEATVRWSQRMRIAGTCERQRSLITLSRVYHERFPEDIDDTLKHEMIHLRYAGHGPAFKREAKRVGASVHCRSYEGIHPRARLLYACPTCWREFYRTKPAELYCGRCSRGKLVVGAKLILKQELKRTGKRRTLVRPAAKSTARDEFGSKARSKFTIERAPGLWDAPSGQ